MNKKAWILVLLGVIIFGACSTFDEDDETLIGLSERTLVENLAILAVERFLASRLELSGYPLSFAPVISPRILGIEGMAEAWEKVIEPRSTVPRWKWDNPQGSVGVRRQRPDREIPKGTMVIVLSRASGRPPVGDGSFWDGTYMIALKAVSAEAEPYNFWNSGFNDEEQWFRIDKNTGKIRPLTKEDIKNAPTIMHGSFLQREEEENRDTLINPQKCKETSDTIANRKQQGASGWNSCTTMTKQEQDNLRGDIDHVQWDSGSPICDHYRDFLRPFTRLASREKFFWGNGNSIVRGIHFYGDSTIALPHGVGIIRTHRICLRIRLLLHEFVHHLDPRNSEAYACSFDSCISCPGPGNSTC